MEFGISLRWFHKNIPDNIWLVDESGKTIKEIPFSDTYISFDLVQTNFTNLFRGLMKQPQRMGRVGYTDEVCSE